MSKTHHPMNLYQRGLGKFIRVELKHGYAHCNDENFHHYGASFYTRFFGFIGLGERGYPEKGSVDGMKVSKGCAELSDILRETLHERIRTSNQHINDNGESPPNNDPMERLPY